MIDHLLSRAIGGVAGAILALAFTPPKTRQGFYQRVTAALIFGPIFGGEVQTRLGFSINNEGLIAATCLASFVSWQIMGVLRRAASTFRGEHED